MTLPDCNEMLWPPTPYNVGDFTEIVEAGATDGVEICEGERTFKVEKDEWNDDYSVRRILKFSAISAS